MSTHCRIHHDCAAADRFWAELGDRKPPRFHQQSSKLHCDLVEQRFKGPNDRGANPRSLSLTEAPLLAAVVAWLINDVEDYFADGCSATHPRRVSFLLQKVSRDRCGHGSIVLLAVDHTGHYDARGITEAVRELAHEKLLAMGFWKNDPSALSVFVAIQEDEIAPPSTPAPLLDVDALQRDLAAARAATNAKAGEVEQWRHLAEQRERQLKRQQAANVARRQRVANVQRVNGSYAAMADVMAAFDGTEPE